MGNGKFTMASFLAFIASHRELTVAHLTNVTNLLSDLTYD